jgi:hypothetical protein
MSWGRGAWRPGGDVRRAVAAEAVLALQPLGSAQRTAQLDLGAEKRNEPVVVPGLLEIIARAPAQATPCHAAPGSRGDGGQRRIERLDLGDQLQPLAAGGGVAGVVEVEQHGVEIGGLQGRQHRRGRAGGLDGVAFALEQQAQRLADVRLVVGDEDARGADWVDNGSWSVRSRES